MALQLDLNKASAKLVLSLQKAGITTPPSVEVAFDLDVSGSFEDEHRDGLTNDLMARLVPWGLVFDPDKQLDVFTFSSRPDSVYNVGSVNADNYEGFVMREIYEKVPGWSGGTDYSYVLQRNLQLFGWAPQDEVAAEKTKSFFGGLFGGGKKPTVASAPVAKRKSLVLFTTDGENSDKDRTERLLAESEARGDGVYFLFLGVSQQEKQRAAESKKAFGKRAFPFIHGLGEKFNNVGFEPISDVREWVSQTDEAINEALISDELVLWFKQ
ncbi:VWA domain-containing protein [Candidatus Nomurabacteria bacterium]|nr:VWA domain-containing protein [Candidatus Kaiserbacteria bacterium]MCB9814669.1 VWA domain-containing protein [Candidatus Nomurabacteria bacterium]